MDDKKKQQSDSYREEMDELARIFKEELDKAVHDAEEAQEMDGIENIEVEGYNPQSLSLDESKAPTETVELCECCGERPRGTEKNPDSPFCEECEAVMEKYPYDWRGILAFVAVLCITIGSLACFMAKTPIFASMKQGDKAVSNSRLYTARAKYEKALSFLPEGKESDFLGLFAKQIFLEYKLVNMDGALAGAEEYFTEAMLKMPMFKDVKMVADEMESMLASVSAIQKHLGDDTKINAETYDETIKTIESLSGKKIYEKDGVIKDELDADFTPDGTENVYVYDEGWLNIYKYSVALLCEKDKSVMAEFLNKAGECSEYLRTLTAPMLASTYAGIGEYDKAEALAKGIREQNAESTDYHMISAMIYRNRDKDYKKGVDMCVEGLNMLASLPGGSDLIPVYGYTLSMQKTLNLIMLKDYNGAYESAEECYSYQAETYSLTLPVRDMYAILALATKDDETFKQLEDDIKQYPEESIGFSSDVTDYKAGKITLEEIAGSGRYDII